MEVRFINKEAAVTCANKTLKTEEWALMPTYFGKRIAWLRIGKIPLEIEEWLTAEIKESVEIIQAARTQQLNWWGYSLELLLHITEKGLKELLEVNELPEEIELNIVVEGKPLTCYGCNQKRHIKRIYSLSISHEPTEMKENLREDMSENGVIK